MANYLAKILLVEDERMVREAVRRKLENSGFQVFEAGDGQEAITIAQKDKPDLILLDLIIPLLDGISVLEKLRAESWGKNIPVIILSNLADSETVEESKKRGVSDYLVKTDWSLDDVVAKVKIILNLK